MIQYEDTISLSGRDGECCIELLSTGKYFYGGGDGANIFKKSEADLLIVSNLSSSSSSAPATGSDGSNGPIYHSETWVDEILSRTRVNLDKLSVEEDLRSTLDCWISKPTNTNATKILVWEPTEETLTNTCQSSDAMMAIETIFAAIIAMAKDYCRTVFWMMPDSNNDSSHQSEQQHIEIFKAILVVTQKWIRRGLAIKKLMIGLPTISGRTVQRIRTRARIGNVMQKMKDGGVAQIMQDSGVDKSEVPFPTDGAPAPLPDGPTSSSSHTGKDESLSSYRTSRTKRGRGISSSQDDTDRSSSYRSRKDCNLSNDDADSLHILHQELSKAKAAAEAATEFVYGDDHPQSRSNTHSRSDGLSARLRERRESRTTERQQAGSGDGIGRRHHFSGKERGDEDTPRSYYSGDERSYYSGEDESYYSNEDGSFYNEPDGGSMGSRSYFSNEGSMGIRSYHSPSEPDGGSQGSRSYYSPSESEESSPQISLEHHPSQEDEIERTRELRARRLRNERLERRGEHHTSAFDLIGELPHRLRNYERKTKDWSCELGSTEDLNDTGFQTPMIVDYDEEIMELMQRANPEYTAQLNRRVHRKRDAISYDQNMPMMTRQALLTKQASAQVQRGRIDGSNIDRQRLLIHSDSMSSQDSNDLSMSQRCSGRPAPGDRRAPPRTKPPPRTISSRMATMARNDGVSGFMQQQPAARADPENRRGVFRTRSNTASFTQYRNKPNRAPSSNSALSSKDGPSRGNLQRAKSTTALRPARRLDPRAVPTEPNKEDVPELKKESAIKRSKQEATAKDDDSDVSEDSDVESMEGDSVSPKFASGDRRAPPRTKSSRMAAMARNDGVPGFMQKQPARADPENRRGMFRTRSATSAPGRRGVHNRRGSLQRAKSTGALQPAKIVFLGPRATVPAWYSNEDALDVKPGPAMKKAKQGAFENAIDSEAREDGDDRLLRGMLVKRNRCKLHAMMYEVKMGVDMKDLFEEVRTGEIPKSPTGYGFIDYGDGYMPPEAPEILNSDANTPEVKASKETLKLEGISSSYFSETSTTDLEIEFLSSLHGNLSRGRSNKNKLAPSMSNDSGDPSKKCEEANCRPAKGQFKRYVVLSFAASDAAVATMVEKMLALVEGNFSIVAEAAKLTTDVFEVNGGRSVLADASRVIALITPNYVRSLACLDQFNECLLAGKKSLQPVLVKDTDLPKYLQVVQFHDARSGRDKLFQALSSIVNSMADEANDDGQGPTSTQQSIRTQNFDDDVVPTGPSFDIFVSYASKMRAQANAILETLRHFRPNIKCFVDVNELHAGAKWQQTLYNALDNSRLVLIVLTPAFLKSVFCREEAAIAALRTMECKGNVIAVETVPIGPPSGGTTKNHLPIEVLNSLVRKETAFDACHRALDLLDKRSGRVDPKERVNFVCDTRLILHESKMKSLREVDESWERLSQLEKNTFGGVTRNNPTICIIGHPKDLHCLGRVQINIERCLVATMANYPLSSPSTSVARIFTPEHYNMDYIDSAAIMICILSKEFLSSGFCMNSLNIGILRNRNEGGYLIPIAIEILDPCSTPSFVRLLPTVDASCWRWHDVEDEKFEEDFVKIQGMIVAAAIMSWSKQWKDRTTLIDACPHDDRDEDSDDDDNMRCMDCTIL